MTETPPPRRALASFLRRPAAAAPPPAAPPVEAEAAAPEEATGVPATEPVIEAAADSPVVKTTPVAEPVTPPAPAPTPSEASATEAQAPSAATPTATPDEASSEAHAPAIAEPDALPIAAPHAPTFARPRASVRAPRAPVWQWIALCALALLLVLQILLADRARLATDARWRPLLSTLCGALHCELPVWHEPAAFSMLDRDVRPAADQPGVLRIQASFRNDARWNQAWPYLQLSLSDADGRVIGSRVFAPEDYLGHAPPPGETLAPGQSGRIDFRVREPAAGTAAFTFDFH
ncbi:DUF3426 domain-containing protein [Stenotrophomonas panacihumi]|uniref:DUF3426 domain-containing protein n=1 Tax=Stenotrophomonas panacihumi TaxID=676599 RepID=UPI0009D78FF5|nr:DUF3426 domain-containing protein [Stenotrophomonas panacihumi]PTN56271.1 DUF3426 domain-containing protein [Stenotrophomonas panacihumi]